MTSQVPLGGMELQPLAEEPWEEEGAGVHQYSTEESAGVHRYPSEEGTGVQRFPTVVVGEDHVADTETAFIGGMEWERSDSSQFRIQDFDVR